MMRKKIRRESDNIIFQMLGEHKQALENINSTLIQVSECLKECKISEVIHEQDLIRRNLRWLTRGCVMAGGVFGSAIFFLLIGHYQILLDWFKFMFH